MINKKGNCDHLNFRRQFLISQEVCQELSHWQHEKFEKFQIYVHQDIELTINNFGHVKLALIGFVIDPSQPKQTNAEVLNGIGREINSIDDVSRCLYSLSGRFTLLVSISERMYVFHDACGLRSVFYAQHKDKVYMGSQPSILEYVIPLEKGDKFAAFNNSSYKENHIEYWLPSNCIIYENVNQLVPNHYLQLKDLRQIRYWPTNQIQSKGVEEVVESVAKMLTNLIKAGSNRFDLALPLTAGWDSRILLASCKDIAEDLYFYTLQYRDLNAASPDIKIPKKILGSFNFAHHLINCNQEPDPSFKEVYFQNVSFAHANWCKIAYGIFLEYPQDKVCLKGSCSEVCRCFYYPSGRHKQIRGVEQLIALVKGWDELAFIKGPLSMWLGEAKKVNKKYSVDILDLFYWEHRVGNWQAQSQLEWDIVQEEFTPFNHRGLLETMLGIPPKYRCGGKDNILYSKIIKKLWPEVLREPVNPKNLMYYYKEILKRIGI